MSPSPKEDLETLIIGAGPAGLQLAYFLEKQGRSYLILEAKPDAGHFFAQYPRHRQLLSINKVYTGYDDPEINLRWDWNSLLGDEDGPTMKDYSERYFPDATDLHRYLKDYADHYKLAVRYESPVERVERAEDGRFRVLSGDQEFHSRRLVVATGVFKPYIPEIEGIENIEAYEDVSVDPKDFRNQRVLIIGKGNSAFETADNLVDTAASIHLASPNSLQLAWQTHFVGHLRAVNNNFLDTYQLKSQNAVLDATVESIERREDGTFAVRFRYAHAHGEREVLVYDRVIRCTGFRFDPSIFADEVSPELTHRDRFPRQTGEWESTNVPDLYFAGVLTQARDYRVTTSAFIHGFRYNSKALFHILEEKYHDEPWPRRSVDAAPEALTAAILERVNRSSSLWQQFGFIADMVQLDGQGGARLYEDVPVDYVHEGDYGEHEDYLLVTLEYGENHRSDNPFAVERVARDDIDRAERSNFLHPVIRHYQSRTLVSEHHIIEDLAAEWSEPEHIDPLRDFLSGEVTPPREPVLV